MKGAALVALLWAGVAMAEGVPSGLELQLYDIVVEPDSRIARFRFVATELRALEYAEVESDLPWLCQHVAWPEIEYAGWAVDQVIVSLGDREVPFGEADETALQYFSVFSYEDGICREEYF